MTPDEATLIEKFRGLSDENKVMAERMLRAFMDTSKRPPAAAAPSNVVKFPIGRIVRGRFYRCKDEPERAELVAAMDSIIRAKKSLERQYQSALMSFRHFNQQAPDDEAPEVDDAG